MSRPSRWIRWWIAASFIFAPGIWDSPRIAFADEAQPAPAMYDTATDTPGPTSDWLALPDEN